jgi:hypothetical protein
MPKQQTTDPYAPPPLHKSKAGPFIRGLILVGLLAIGGVVAYTVTHSPSPQTAGLEPQQTAQNDRLADGSYAVSPQAAAPPEAQPAQAAPAPTPTERRAPAPRRRTLPGESAPPTDQTPTPEAPTAAPPAPAQPLAPDVSPGA